MKGVKDHLGNVYNSEIEMCKHYNIEYYNFRNRIKKGFSLEDALCKPKHCRENPIVDHLGNIFENEKYLCEFWGIDPYKYAKRKERGWTMEERLTKNRRNKRRDHTDQKFISYKEMAQEYNIPYVTLLRRIKDGWTLEQALEEPLRKKRSQRTYFAPDGKTYESIAEMCEAFNIKKSTFYKRKELGQSLFNCLRPPNTDPLPE